MLSGVYTYVLIKSVMIQIKINKKSVSTFRVADNMPLYDILNEFQKGHSHIAVVYKDLNKKIDTLKKSKDTESERLS